MLGKTCLSPLRRQEGAPRGPSDRGQCRGQLQVSLSGSALRSLHRLRSLLRTCPVIDVDDA